MVYELRKTAVDLVLDENGRRLKGLASFLFGQLSSVTLTDAASALSLSHLRVQTTHWRAAGAVISRFLVTRTADGLQLLDAFVSLLQRLKSPINFRFNSRRPDSSLATWR